jgi:hypothetical protein
MKIVLLGSLPKGDDTRKSWIDWKKEYIDSITKLLPDAEFIHGDSMSDSAGAEMVVGHDLAQIKKADVCVVDARSKIGAGTAQEIVIAKQFKKPVIIVIPKDTHHRKSNIIFHGVEMKEWIHPFLKISTDYVADSIDDAARWIEGYVSSPSSYAIKDLSVFEKAIEIFEDNQPQK